MFVGRILTGVWDEETIILKGMPKDFTLSARDLVVMEIDEYELLKTACKLARNELLEITNDSYALAAIKQALKG